MFSSSFVRSSVARVASKAGRAGRFESTAANAKAAVPAVAASSGGGGGFAMPLALISLGAAGYVYNDCQSKVGAMENQIDSLQLELSGKTNSGEDANLHFFLLEQYMMCLVRLTWVTC
jgi:hypothetical protein